MPRAVLLLPALAVLAACATPQERCIREGAREQARLLEEIKTAEGNIARGYAIHRQTVPEIVYQSCPRLHDGKVVGYYPCPETYYRTIETPVSINIGEERKKLRGLKDALPGAQRRAQETAAQCRADFPE
ncbi:hypothetical protein HCZ87_19665 [Phaeobacter sp. HF9A]|nr:hypothetical protein [Phaeobacter sp. HF9A]